MVEMGLKLSKRVSIRHGGQVSRLMGILACNKWPTDDLRREVAGGGQGTGVPG
jgi:hypothetical protein